MHPRQPFLDKIQSGSGVADTVEIPSMAGIRVRVPYALPVALNAEND
jgi:hypothetical protein